MGTSSIYGGPKDKNHLLPDDYEPDNETLEKEKKHEPWKAAKKSMSQIVTGSSSNYKGVVRNHIRASGGSTRMTESSTSGRASMIRLGKLLNSIASEGVRKTFEDLRINLDGKSVDNLLSELVNVISFSSDTKEEIVAKDATIDSLMLLYEYIEENNLDIECLDRIDSTIFDLVLSRYISSYIWGRMLNDLQSSFEKYSSDPNKSLEIEKDFKEYIKNTVEVELGNTELNARDFDDKNISEVVFDLYNRCYSVLGGLL